MYRILSPDKLRDNNKLEKKYFQLTSIAMKLNQNVIIFIIKNSLHSSLLDLITIFKISSKPAQHFLLIYILN